MTTWRSPALRLAFVLAAVAPAPAYTQTIANAFKGEDYEITNAGPPVVYFEVDQGTTRISVPQGRQGNVWVSAVCERDSQGVTRFMERRNDPNSGIAYIERGALDPKLMGRTADNLEAFTDKGLKFFADGNSVATEVPLSHDAGRALKDLLLKTDNCTPPASKLTS